MHLMEMKKKREKNNNKYLKETFGGEWWCQKKQHAINNVDDNVIRNLNKQNQIKVNRDSEKKPIQITKKEIIKKNKTNF